MREIPLITITYNPSQDAIDFGIPVSADRLIVQKHRELMAMLRRLADCLERREYPFGNMENDPEAIRQLLLNVVREHKRD